MQEELIREGFRFNGSHTSDYGLRLIVREGNPPTEKEIIEDIPFMQGQLDFSNILGQRVFNNRILTYTFELIDYDYESRKIDETILSNWLLSVGRQKLFDDYDRGYYYMAKCASVESIDNYHGTSYKITFDAYPFKIAEIPEGNDIWDIFNFELDVSQNVKFDIKDTQTIVIYNNGTNIISPTIKSSSPMKIVQGGITYILNAGETKSHELVLKLGENKMTVHGNGTIEFLFHKELI